MKKVLLVVLFIGGCVSAQWTPEYVSGLADRELCVKAGWKNQEANNTMLMQRELFRRNLMTRDELAMAKRGGVAIGMSECALLGSKGEPASFFACGNINQSVGSYGVHKQYVYRDCTTKAAYYVYVENGKVTSWQN